MNSQRYSWILKLAIVLLLVEENYAQVKRCEVLVNGGLADPQPLILNPKMEHTEFIYPSLNGNGRLLTPTGESVRVACPGSKLKLNAPGIYNDLLLKCNEEGQFTTKFSKKNKESFSQISCENYPTFDIKKNNSYCSTGTPYTIGNSLIEKTSNGAIKSVFLGLIDLCHDETLAHTHWAHARISASIGWGQTAAPRPDFRTEGFYRGLGISTFYTKKSQRETLGRILNDQDVANVYIPTKGNLYLARGHLIASADFIYRSQQRATFYYVNAVPMWQNINAGNWGTMEANVRSYAFTRKRDLDVWTGSVGILTLSDRCSVPHEVYLYYDVKKNEKRVPVPKILYKIVYEPTSQAAIVFLTANNPYMTGLGNYAICKNVCHKIGYMTWKPNDMFKGLSYCCEYNDFKRAVQSAPSLTVVNLLV